MAGASTLARVAALVLLALAGLLFVVSLRAAFAQTEPRTVRIGVLAYRGAEEADRSWRSTLDRLTEALPGYRFETIVGTAPFLTSAVAGERLDFVITNPGHYLELKLDYSASAIATEQDLGGPPAQEALGAAVFVPSSDKITQSLADLRGATIAVASAEAFGFRVASREFKERGVDPEKDLNLLFIGFPVDEIVRAVASGQASAGVIRSCSLEQLVKEGAIAQDAFRVVGRRPADPVHCQSSTRLYPNWPFIRVAQTPDSLAREVTQALLSMQPAQDEKIWLPPADYDEVVALYRALKVGPYAPFSRLGLQDFLFEHRYVASLIGLGLLWWVVHVGRVSHLVRQRTLELQQAHEATRVRAERMEHTLRLSLMGEMASSLAHEINQPLAAILSYSRGCERRLANGADPHELSEAVRRISVQAERAGDIVRRMKDFVRKNPAPQVPLNPAPVLRDALALFQPSAAAAHVTLEADVPEKLPIIRADRLQLEEVVINLLQNASDALKGKADRHIRLAAQQEGQRLVVSVTDNGPGMDAGTAEKLFDPFFTTKADGLGLGLSLSRTIVEAHGGQLGVDLGVAGQTTFRFYLPIIEETRLG